MYHYHPGYVVAQFVQAPENRGFDSRWCNFNFSLAYSFRPHWNEYQEYALGDNSGRCIVLTTLTPSCANVWKFGNLNFLEPSWPVQTFTGTALPFYHYHPGMLYLSRYSHSLRPGRPEDRIPVRTQFSAPPPDWSWGPLTLLYSGYQIVPWG